MEKVFTLLTVWVILALILSGLILIIGVIAWLAVSGYIIWALVLLVLFISGIFTLGAAVSDTF